MRNIVFVNSFQSCRLSTVRTIISINFIVTIFAIRHIIFSMLVCLLVSFLIAANSCIYESFAVLFVYFWYYSNSVLYFWCRAFVISVFASMILCR